LVTLPKRARVRSVPNLAAVPSPRRVPRTDRLAAISPGSSRKAGPARLAVSVARVPSVDGATVARGHAGRRRAAQTRAVGRDEAACVHAPNAGSAPSLRRQDPRWRNLPRAGTLARRRPRPAQRALQDARRAVDWSPHAGGPPTLRRSGQERGGGTLGATLAFMMARSFGSRQTVADRSQVPSIPASWAASIAARMLRSVRRSRVYCVAARQLAYA